MSDEKFETAERPEHGQLGVKISPLSQAVVDTVINGKSVRVELNGVPLQRLQNRFAVLARTRGLRLRRMVSADRTHAYFWLEKAEPQK